MLFAAASLSSQRIFSTCLIFCTILIFIVGSAKDSFAGTDFFLNQENSNLLINSLTPRAAARSQAGLLNQSFAPGDLDQSFGGGGKVTTPVSSSRDDVGRSVVVQPDGKIVVAGYGSNGLDNDFAIVRYNADGSLDTSFAVGGKALTPVGSGDDLAFAVVLQADSKIVVVGYSSSAPNISMAVVRYNTNGSLDTSFDGDGKALIAVGGADDEAFAAAVQPDGKIVVAGYSLIASRYQFAAVRLNITGSLDSTFGTGGKTTTQLGGGSDFAFAAALQPDGKIVLGGVSNSNNNSDFGLVRYNTDGTLDTTFSGDGKVVTPIGSADDYLTALTVQANGKIVAAGYTNNTTSDFALARFNADGALDTTFGSAGKVISAIGTASDEAYGVRVISQEKIVVAGLSSNGANLDFALVRYNLSGTLDTSFGTEGKVITPIGIGSDAAYAMTFQSDNKILLAGASSNGSNNDFAVARYLNEISSCTYNITGGSTGFTSSGGPGSLSFTTQPGCTWQATSVADWITITNGSGTGSGSISFTVSANNGTWRSAYINIGDATVEIRQNLGCTYSVSLESTSAPATGGNISGTLTSGTGCELIPSTAGTSSWLSSARWNPGLNFLTVQPNNGAARTGNIRFVGQTGTTSPTVVAINITITQASGCKYPLSSPNQNFNANGGQGAFSIASPNPTCHSTTYTAASNAPWITVANPSGTVAQFINYQVAANVGPARTGTITVTNPETGSQTFTVTQNSGCAYVFSPGNLTIGASGGNSTINLTTNSACNWTAATSESWININSGSGSGNGTISISVQPNSGPSRTGTITVGGQTFTINQASGCTYSLNQNSTTFGASGGVGSFNLTTNAACSWTATTNDNWITINSGGRGSGSGSITFTVQQNVGLARTATISVGGQTFTIVQNSGCSYNLSATGANLPNTAASGNFIINTGADCAWTASSSADWVTITSGTSGTGTGTISYAVQSNNGAARIAALTVGGQTFTINQSAATQTRTALYDFDGDRKADISIFRPSAGEWWYLRSFDGGNRAFAFGDSADRLVPADYTGDGKTDVALWRPSSGHWLILRSDDSSYYAFPFGMTGDIPAPADYDGDGRADAAVFRPSTATWFILKSSGGTLITRFGAEGDVPIASDYDGDNKADIAIYRPNAPGGAQWWIMRSSSGQTIAFQFGLSSDKAVFGDYTGDGKTDVALYRPSSGQWLILRSEDASYYAFPFGAPGDVPAPGDYDGDGKTDAAVFRPSSSTWFVNLSNGGTLITRFGVAGDVPVPNAFVP